MRQQKYLADMFQQNFIYLPLHMIVHFPMCVLCVLPEAFPPVPATSDPLPSAVVVSSAVPPLTGTAGLHTAACLLPCPTRTNTSTHTDTNVQQKRRGIATDMHTNTGHTRTEAQMKRNMHTQDMKTDMAD